MRVGGLILPQTLIIHRFDKIVIDLPTPESPDAKTAAAVRRLMGGKLGELSILMNYPLQSFNFREREKCRPLYDLIVNIAAEWAARLGRRR